MLEERTLRNFLFIYLGCLFFASFMMVPTLTSLYYYSWGKELALSYFDGPPMIAYLFYLSRLMLGDTYYAISSVGLICILLATYYVYLTGRLLNDRRTGIVAAMIWCALPLTTQNVFARVLYDGPLNLFTAASIFYFCRYFKNQSIKDLYWGMLSLGLMMLSKYTGIVTIIAILSFILLSQYRKLLVNKHFYFAACLGVVVVLPIIIWNVEHQWSSVIYLLTAHGRASEHLSSVKLFFKLMLSFFANYSVFLIVSLLGMSKEREKAQAINFINTVVIVTIVFWFLTLFIGIPRTNYLTPLGVTIALSSAYYLVKFNYKRTFIVAYSAVVLVSAVVIIGNTFWATEHSKKGAMYSLTKKFKNNYLKQHANLPIVSNSYTSASTLGFFIPERSIYSLPCHAGNQYKYWSEAFVKQVKQGDIKKIAYVDFSDSVACAKQFFNQCTLVSHTVEEKVVPILNKSKGYAKLYVYECSEPRRSVPV